MPGLPSANSPTPENSFSRMDNNLYRCLLTKVLYVDDPMNVTSNAVNPQIIYEAVILGGFMEGQSISNIRLASWLGGQYNYAERVLRAASKPTNEIPLAEQDGDIVFVQFIQGDLLAPIIIGLGTQPLDGEATGAARADGPLWVEQYNGVETKIDNKGNYSVTQKGGELEDGVFTPNETESDFGGVIKLEDGKIVLNNDVNNIIIDRVEGLTTIDSESNSIVVDGVTNMITISNTDGDNIEVSSGSIIISNSAGIEINLSSSGITIMGGGTADIRADIINLNAGMVNVGEGAGLHAAIFENLKSEFESHVHMVPQAMAGILPSQKPLIPLTPSVGSQTVTVKD